MKNKTNIKKIIKLSLFTAALTSALTINTATAATQVVQVQASIDTSLSVTDISGVWNSPIVMNANSAGDGLITRNILLNFTANDYKDVEVTLQSFPSLSDPIRNVSIPLEFKINNTALVQNTATTLDKADLFTYDATNSVITGSKDIPLSIASTSTTTLQSGTYSGVFTIDFSLAP
ncbi:CS1 type fimbrial major subunit [Shewanella nanhaiensis]|uniref:CS1 type fimbrial major subunit n=1 Tax=Shewanella nanhaiensis TaxID=2864872 RepID=A0ABS7E3D6_9GAMM|nr:CS1 type fimbrial major subunit [Shewanella nanhaiensis]MBW8184075.1 hypothetical protein [Shewanella nanhaiensis]